MNNFFAKKFINNIRRILKKIRMLTLWPFMVMNCFLSYIAKNHNIKYCEICITRNSDLKRPVCRFANWRFQAKLRIFSCEHMFFIFIYTWHIHQEDVTESFSYISCHARSYIAQSRSYSRLCHVAELSRVHNALQIFLSSWSFVISLI